MFEDHTFAGEICPVKSGGQTLYTADKMSTSLETMLSLSILKQASISILICKALCWMTSRGWVATALLKTCKFLTSMTFKK